MKKIIKKKKYIFTHERYIDDWGFERDGFDLFDSEKRIHYPFIGMIKVSNLTKNSPINKLGFEYTAKDYKEMIVVRFDILNRTCIIKTDKLTTAI